MTKPTSTTQFDKWLAMVLADARSTRMGEDEEFTRVISECLRGVLEANRADFPWRKPNSSHLAKLRRGVADWNRWIEKNPSVVPNLRAVELGGADLRKADLMQADLMGAELKCARLNLAALAGANLMLADLSHADLRGANLSLCDLRGANLFKADLKGTLLCKSDLSDADLRGADLTGADLERARLIRTDLRSSTLTDCRIYGISAWELRLQRAGQRNLIVTPKDQPVIQVDNLEIAQFIYLLLKNENIRGIIDTITSKVVLILGRFTDERKAVLEAIRARLRKRDLVPVLFDFEKPSRRDLTETIGTLAHMARFVIADITDARSIPQELMAIVPRLPSVPVQPLLLASQNEYGMFEHFRRFNSVLEPVFYKDQKSLLAELEETVIAPALAKAGGLDVPHRRKRSERQHSKLNGERGRNRIRA